MFSLKKLKSSVLMFPEASYSFDGTATPLPDSLGKCLKMLGVPVAMIRTYGAFARDPLYNNLKLRQVDVSADVEYLLSPEEKKERLERYNIDYLIRCPFIPEILGMEPETFVKEVLKERLHAKYVVVGTDFHFGHNRKGNAGFLKTLEEAYDMKVIVMEKECFNGREISSTYIRESLALGNMELVGELLGYEYPVSGIVQHGKKLGRRLGMPTVNLIPEPGKLLPPCGVYYSDVFSGGNQYCGVTNIGYKPTVDGSFLGVETYLYDFHQDVYGKEATVCLRHYERPEQKFDSVESLKQQMQKDIQLGKQYFNFSG